MKVMWLGVGLTLVMITALTAVFGRTALLPAVAFGGLATVIQVVAVATAKPAMRGDFQVLMVRWSVGMGLRLLGVVLLAVAMAVDQSTFPPLPSAFGFLGVMVPLLFMEPRFLK